MIPFENQGLWWLPETPDAKCSGTLRCNETGELHLEILGALVDYSSFHRGDQSAIIHGEIANSKLGSVVTLTDCFVTKMGGVLRTRLTQQQFFAHRAFFGAHLSNVDDFSFVSSTISFSGLDAWANSFTGFQKSLIDPFTVSFKSPEPIFGEIPGGSFSLGLGCESSGTKREQKLIERAGLVLTFSRPIGDSALQNNFVFPLQNLFTFATDLPNSLTELTVTRYNKPYDKITVIGSLVFSDNSLAMNLQPWQMLFGLSDVTNRLNQVVLKWLQFSERFRSAAAVFFGTLYDPPSYVDLRFPLMIQTLSLYHAQRGELKATTFADDLLKSTHDISGERVEALKRLIDSHPLVLAERALKDLTEENRQVFEPLVRVKGSLANFVETTLGIFEYLLTRSSENLWAKSFGREVYWLTERVSFLVKICFLNEIGFSSQDQESIFQRNQRYTHLRGEAS